jgi:hypothetical protein
VSICSTCILTPCNGFKWQQRARRELERADSLGPRHPEYRYSTEFQSHEPEVMFHFSLDVWAEGVSGGYFWHKSIAILSAMCLRETLYVILYNIESPNTRIC